MSRADISVVLPTRNRRRSLEHVLPSYLSQPELGELVVVVNGSTDGTSEYVRSVSRADDRIRLIDNAGDRGLPYSKNVGIAAAQHELLFFGEDDLELTDGFLATLLAHRDQSGADVICGREVWRHEDEPLEAALERADRLAGPYVDRRSMTIQTGRALDDDSEQPMLAAPMLAPTEVFRRVHFDEGYRVNFFREETDFQFSAKHLGYRLVYCPHALCVNFMLRADRGGTHADAGARRMWWTARNTARLLHKHRALVRAEFDLGNPASYVLRSAGSRAWREEVVPRLSDAKHRLAGNGPATQVAGERASG